MNILNHLTIKNLKLNKKRTIVTIIGIILSTALICSIAGFATSLMKSMKHQAILNTGDYHIAYLNVPDDELKYIKDNRYTDSFYQTSSLGYAKIDNKNEFKPYLYIEEYDLNALNKSSIKVIEGRLPENDNEIIIPEHLCDYGYICKIGTKINLEIGKRISDDGFELDQSNPYYDYDEDLEEYVTNKETITNVKKHEYTIVGIMERASYELEGYSAPGYLSITFNNNINSDKSNIYVKYTNPKDIMNYLCEVTATNDGEKNKCLNNSDYEKKFDYIYNSEVLRWEGVIRSDNTKTFLLGIISFVIGIVVISSILVIRNSFSISITERYKQYGMLASIGATQKQIRKNVLFEGFILGIIAIPLGVLLGIIADILLVNIVNLIVQKANLLDGDKLLYLSISILPIIITIIISSLTIFVSALLPAIKVARISPIEAIRSNNDVKIKARKLRSSKLIKKIFGIGGEIANKNLKRSKKKYRTTIISIVVSIVIFISLSSFVEYGFNLTNTYYQTQNYNVSIFAKNGLGNASTDKMFEEYEKISKLDDVEKYAYSKGITVSVPIEYKSDDWVKYYYNGDTNNIEETEIYVPMEIFNDEEYERLTEGLNLNDHDKEYGVILIDNNIIYENNKQKEAKFLNVNENDKITITLDDKSKMDITILGYANTENSLTPNEGVIFIASKEFATKHPELFNNALASELYLKCSDSKEVTKYIDNYNKNTNNDKLIVFDDIEEAKQQNAFILIISIFLYGFIAVIALIGVTNIFNVITTNMMLRSKEFAMLKAIGMTDKEFKKMINLESLLYGLKSLVIGLIIGLILSYKIFDIFSSNMLNSTYIPPIKAIIISIIFVFLIIFITMRYSYSKINKQNIIETIRNDNI